MTRSLLPISRKGWQIRLQGFTLIELIAVLFLVGILGALATVGLNQSVRSYMIATENANIAQKAQLALTRLGLELGDCREGCAGPAPTLLMESTGASPIIQFDFRNGEGNRRIRFDVDRILIGPAGNERILVDRVSEFSIRRIINPIDNEGELFVVLMRLNHLQTAQSITFRTRVYYQR
jgi:prepilin-type N-terminal cleavage/methylation domain-containing protein